MTAVYDPLVVGMYDPVRSPMTRRPSTVVEAVETFLLNLSNPVNATILDGQGVGTIQRNPILISVTVTRTTGKVPLAVGFNATATVSGHTTNPSHDLLYFWNFDDAAGETWAHGPNTGLDKNVAFGPVAGHVFKTAGVRNPQLVVLDGRGNSASLSVTITGTAWAAADTIYIANGALPVAGVNGVESGATYYNESTWAGVASRWATNKRIMLKRGDTWACAASTAVPAGCQIDSYGSGTYATVTSSGDNQVPFSLNAGQNDVRICNVQHTGPRTNIADSGTIYTSNTPPTNLLVLNVVSTGTTYGLITASGTANEIFIQDCDFQEHDSNGVGYLASNICLYVSHVYGLYILGSKFSKAASHTVRLNGVQRCVVDSCHIDEPAQNLGTSSHALTIREIGDNTGTWPGEWTEDVVISNCYIASDRVQWTFHIHHAGALFAGRFRRILVERNFIDAKNLCFITEAQETLTFRSNICITQDWDNAIIVYNGNTATPDASPDPDGLQFYNNTIYCTRAGMFNAFQLGGSVTAITNTVIRNNLIYAPNSTSRSLIATTGTVTGTIESNNSSAAQMLSTRPWASATPVLPIDFTPTNYAIGAGLFDYRSQRDFFNARIAAPVDMGAIQT